MPDQLTADENGLRLFFTDDVYLVNEPAITWGLPVEPVSTISTTTKADVTASTAGIEGTKITNFEYLGGNGRNILILVNDNDHEVSDDKGKELLRKIVKSMNLVSADFALLNYAKYQGTNFQELAKFFKCSLVFSFGVAPSQLGLEDHPSNTVVMDGQVRLIFSKELRELNEDTHFKKELWTTIQKLEL